jgi:transposase InsO family protein
MCPGTVQVVLSRPSFENDNILNSMGRPGSALDNGVIESWHSTLELELRQLEHYRTKAHTRAAGGWVHR